jgi:small-conductance mechanosensitive channel
MKIKQEVEKIGLGFAFPSQSIYIENLKKEDISKI